MVTKVLRKLARGWCRSGKQSLSNRPRPRPFLEPLEDRLLPSSSQLPLHLLANPSNHSPFGTAMADLPTAEVHALYQLTLGREPEAYGQNYWTALMQSGTNLDKVLDGFLKSPEYAANLVQGYYTTLLGRPAELAGLSHWAAVWALFGDTNMLVAGFTSSPEYTRLHPTDQAFVQSLYHSILGREGSDAELGLWQDVLAAGVGRGAVATAVATSDEGLTGTVEQWYQSFLQRPAEPAGLAYWVAVAKIEPLSLELGQILTSPEFQFRAASGTAGQPLRNFVGFNQHTLASDPVTDPVTSGSPASAGPMPRDSPWGQALVFPNVPYDSVATEKAVQPTLQFPADLLSSVDLNNGGTFQFWFQAKNPGVLLSATIPTTGDTATGSYPAPLVYINAGGKLVAGLFDQTALSVVPHQFPLSWKDGDQTHIGAAHPLVSQVGVLDNTWHHAALAFSAHSEALYLDGILQGMSQPQVHQTSTKQVGDTVIVVPLKQAPSALQMISGTISQLNPAEDTSFGPDGTHEVARFQGWTSTTINLTQTSGTSPVSSVVYNQGSLVFTLKGSINKGNALSIDVSYSTAGGAYSFKPASTSTWSTAVHTLAAPSSKASFGDPRGLTVGGTIFAEPTSKLYPAMNYPQGFVGTVDEVALWNATLGQREVQSAMAGPVGGPAGKLPDHLVGYFPFTHTGPGKSNAWPNEAPGATTFATGPTQGTVPTPAGSTIPTDPFPNAARLPGARAWGLDIMTPLASPSVTLKTGTTYEFKVGLALGDQFKIQVPEAQHGSLALVVEDDLGRTSPATVLSPNSKQYLAAARTGTYKLTLTWTSVGNTDSGVVNFGLIAGPLNSVLELFASYVQGISPTQTNTVQAYSDPALPGINPTVGTDQATGAANYWPLWGDPTYFPSAAAYTPAELNAAYRKLNETLRGMQVGLSDFANINGALVDDPATIQQYLDQAYQLTYDKAPPTPPVLGPFPVLAATTPQEAVYEFLYNANLKRQTIYSALKGTAPSLLSWVKGMHDLIDVSDSVPVNIATTIATGQTQQVRNITVNVFQPSEKPSIGEILINGLISAVGGLVSALPGIGEIAGPALKASLVLLAGGLGGGGAALGQGGADYAFASDGNTTSFTVPVASITNNELNYESLNAMAVSIKTAALQLWNNISTAISTPAFAQSVLSNYGLLNAFAVMSGAPLGDDAASAADAVKTSLTRSSWQEMIPAVFAWTPVVPDAFPTGNGETNDWATSGPFALGNNATGPDVNGITSADFNKDGKLDVAVANYGSSDVSILLGNGDGTFGKATVVGLNGPNGARGITTGDFFGHGNQDLVVSDYSSDVLSILAGDGHGGFQPARQISLNGPDNPRGIVSGDFNNDHQLDLAVANSDSPDVPTPGGSVSLLLGNGNGTFQPGQAVDASSGGPPLSVATGHFTRGGNLDLAVAYFGNRSLIPTHQVNGFVHVLLGDGHGGFAAPVSLDTGQMGTVGIAVEDLNGDGLADIAVTNADSANITVWLNNGDGTSFSQTTYPLASGSSGPNGIALARVPSRDGRPNLVVACADSNTINVFFNRGDGTFLPAITIPVRGSGPYGVTVAEFAGNGLEQAAVANKSSNDVLILSPTGVGNTATFLPGASKAITPLGGPTDLEKTVDPTALDNLLTQMTALQGGNTVQLGPFDERSLITPSGITPPNFMAFTSLAYPPNGVPLSLNAPGMFLTLTPATLKETAKSGDTDLSYIQNGAYLAGWTLIQRESNGTPIAPETLRQLFQTPVVDQDTRRPVGTNLTPVDPGRPFAAFNGGWYFDAEPVNGATATWAEAFFGWGLGTSDYSPRNLIPSEPLAGNLPNTATPGVSVQNIAYTLSFQPAADSPPPAPAFTSAAGALFTETHACRFTVQATGAVQPVLSESTTDVLPKGITFNPATGVLGGTPAAGSAGTYILNFTAGSGAGKTSQTFTLNVYSVAASEKFVQALYRVELNRLGSPADVAGWVDVLGTRGQAAVAAGVANSDEARGRVVAGWYQTYLGRPASQREAGLDADALITHTREQVLNGVLGSLEFFSNAQNMNFGGTADQNYVQALYQAALGRPPSSAELAEQVARLQQVVPQQLALLLLQGPEYRTNVVRAYYVSLLHRAGSPEEVASLVATGIDLYTIRVGIEGSVEFFLNG